jgi:hypothetical protein
LWASPVHDLEVGHNGISEATIFFWNSGTLPILADEVLEPYTITIRNVPILAHSVLKSSRDVIGMKLSYLGEDEDRLELGFAVLEPGDGVSIRLIFDGPPTSKIAFSGACLESRKPTVLEPDPIYSYHGQNASALLMAFSLRLLQGRPYSSLSYWVRLGGLCEGFLDSAGSTSRRQSVGEWWCCLYRRWWDSACGISSDD